MIDKLDVRIPAETPFHPEFQRLYTQLRSDPKNDPFRFTRHYSAVGDLRPYGYSAILHIGCKWGKAGNHKLELLDTGTMSFSRLVNEIERIFQIDGRKAGVMRLDLAVDVRDISVSWFQCRLKANHKQFIANFGSAEFIELGRGGIQTLYFGKRPNLYRIYDKVAEYKYQYAKLLRDKEDGDVPTFEEFCGLKETDIITRVERQIGGKIPEQFSTVGQLRTLDTYDPFDNLKIIVGGTSEPNPDDYGFIEYCAGMFLRQKAEREGMHAMIKFIAKHSNRNTGKVRDKFTPFFPEKHDNEMVNTYYLNERFRRSVARQLAV